jgi:exosortase
MPVEVSTHSDSSHVGFHSPVAARNTLFVLLMAASTSAFLVPLRNLVSLCMGNEEYSYILLIPIMVFGLFYLEHNSVFKHLRYSLGAGALVMSGGLSVAAGAVLCSQFSPDGRLSLEMLGLVTIWIGAFVLCYGAEASRAGLFAVLFSLLLVPLPQNAMALPIASIQHGSADVAAFLFTLAGVPAFREGLTFSLPHLSFIVATECSGIHSSIALFIATILAGHFYFKPGWKRPLLVLLVFPLISFTNGFRIFALATLAVYVDMSFFNGNLHHRGGSLFFALALLILAGVVKLLGGRLRLAKAISPQRGTSAQA